MAFKKELTTTPDGYETYWHPNDDMGDYGAKFDANGHFITNKKMSTVAQRLADLYVSYRGKYNISIRGKNNEPVVFMPKKDGKPKHLTQRNLEYHLFHYYAVHVFAGRHGSKFICFDIDTADWQFVHDVVNAIEKYGVPREYIYPSYSGNKGYHVEVFFDDMVYTNRMKAMYNDVVKMVGHDGVIEFKPTNDHSIKLPLSTNASTGNVCWYVDRDTGEYITDIDYIFDIKQMSASVFQDMVGDVPIEEHVYIPRPRNETYNDVDPTTIPDWAPMLMSPNTRHNTMMQIAIGARFRHYGPDATLALLMTWLDAQPKEYYDTTMDKCQKDAANIRDWVFENVVVKEKKGRKILDNYLPIAERGTYIITAEWMDRVMSIKGNGPRHLFFLTMAEQMADGRHFQCTMRRIAEILGVAYKTVVDSIAKLKDKKRIWQSESHVTFYGDKPYQTPHHYRVSVFDADKHGVATGKVYVGNVLDLEANFMAEYLRACYTIYDEEWMNGNLTKKERDAA